MTVETAIRLVHEVVEELAFEVDIKPQARCRYRQKLTEALSVLTTEQNKEREGPKENLTLAEGVCCAEARQRIVDLENRLAEERKSQKSAVRSALEMLKKRMELQNERHDEFKNEIKEFLEQSANNNKKDARLRIGSAFSSVAKPSPRFRRQTEMSFAHESKADAKNLLDYFDYQPNKENQTPHRSQQGGSSSKYSDGGLLPPRIVESAEKKGLKKNFMTFKHALLSEEKLSDRKAPQSHASEMDLPDFTLECLTNREVDPQNIADQYDVGDSCRRPLLHVEEQDLDDVRSLPISLKGSSTFQ